MMQKEKKYFPNLPKLGTSERKVLDALLCAMDRDYYLRDLKFNPFNWQTHVINDPFKRKVILASRQSGKSKIVSSIPCHTAKYYPKSVSIITAPTETQAELDMNTLKDFMAQDKNYPKKTRNSDSLIELDNGSRIYVVPATDKAARGYSAPRCIILDEASRIEDVVYISGIRPMLTNNPKCELILLSTPEGKKGFFYRAFNASYWHRYFIRTPYAPLITNQMPTIQRISEEEEMQTTLNFKKKGIDFFTSDRHSMGGFQEAEENFKEMGMHQYMQEYMCEFVEPNDVVFSYDDIDKMFNSPTISEFNFPDISQGEIDDRFDILEML